VTAWSQTHDSSLPKLPLRVCSVAKVMSVARPRPRPKPRRPEALKSAPQVRRSLKVDDQEESVAKAARELWKDKSRGTVKSAEWSESDGLLMFHGKIYVPKDKDLSCAL
jgi:hypothetical protein